jgi:hypothetical protein
MTFKTAMIAASLSLAALTTTAANANRFTWKSAGEASWDNRFDSRADTSNNPYSKGNGEAAFDSRFDKRPTNTSGKSFKGARSENWDPRFGF